MKKLICLIPVPFPAFADTLTGRFPEFGKLFRDATGV